MSTNKRNYKKGGGCGCNSGGMHGNEMIIRGGGALGPASFNNFDSNHQYSYAVNTHESDPLAPSAQDDTRMDPNMNAPWNPFLTGGKRKSKKAKKSKKSKKSKKVKKSKKSKKSRRTRKYRGGGDPIMDSQLANIINSTGTIQGAYIGANIVTGNENDILNPQLVKSAAPFI